MRRGTRATSSRDGANGTHGAYRANGIGAVMAGGFTLIEVLAALVFLAILVPAVVSALTISTRVSTLAERRSVATELAENQLNEELLANTWQSGAATQGDFGPAYPGYTWQMTQTSWGGAGTGQAGGTSDMTQLTMEVTFPVQGQAQSVKLTTLVSANLSSAQQSATSGTNSTGTGSSSMPGGDQQHRAR